MFQIDVTIEDTRLIGQSDSGNSWECSTYDLLTGQRFDFMATSEQLSAVLAVALHLDGKGGTPEQQKTAAEVFTHAQKECRFIP